MKELDPTTKFIFEKQLISIMNKTKWKELADEMTSNPDFNPTVRIKYLRDVAEPKGFCHLDWQSVKTEESRYIEWMEIDSVKRDYIGRLVPDKTSDFSNWTRKSLIKHAIPFEENGKIFLIKGYIKPR
jgi:hypothetical protein